MATQPLSIRTLEMPVDGFVVSLKAESWVINRSTVHTIGKWLTARQHSRSTVPSDQRATNFRNQQGRDQGSS